VKHLGCFTQAVFKGLVDHFKDMRQGAVCRVIISAFSYERSASALVHILDLCAEIEARVSVCL
jgi:hypothetical protein